MFVVVYLYSTLSVPLDVEDESMVKLGVFAPQGWLDNQWRRNLAWKSIPWVHSGGPNVAVTGYGSEYKSPKLKNWSNLLFLPHMMKLGRQITPQVQSWMQSYPWFATSWGNSQNSKFEMHIWLSSQFCSDSAVIMICVFFDLQRTCAGSLWQCHKLVFFSYFISFVNNIVQTWDMFFCRLHRT